MMITLVKLTQLHLAKVTIWTLIVSRNYAAHISIDLRLEKVIEAVQELEHLLGYDKLDVEFGFNDRGECFTFKFVLLLLIIVIIS